MPIKKTLKLISKRCFKFSDSNVLFILINSNDNLLIYQVEKGTKESKQTLFASKLSSIVVFYDIRFCPVTI
jgi:hypothetical protein